VFKTLALILGPDPHKIGSMLELAYG